MKFNFDHFNRNVSELDRSLAFYRDALGFKEISRHVFEGNVEVFLKATPDEYVRLELSFPQSGLPDRPAIRAAGGFASHFAVRTDDFVGSFLKHQALGVIVRDHRQSGNYYVIADPDNYWTVILPPNDHN